MSRRQLYHLWDFISRIVGAIPPVLISLYYFPIWIETSEKATVSGIVVITALIASIPLFKKFKSFFDFITNASMPVLWGIGAGVCYVFMNIANQMFAICIGGLIGSAISAGICLIRNKYDDGESEKEREKKEKKKKD